MKTPINQSIANKIIDQYKIADFGRATIREVVAISNEIEKESGIPFIHMEMGMPGLPPAEIGVEAEMEALKKGISGIYPNIDGLPALKAEASRFVKAFLDVDVPAGYCVPVSGSMQGSYASFVTAGQCQEERDTILFIDPGFPVQKQQIAVIGMKYESFDVYNFRGGKLEAKLDELLGKGNIAAIIYSNPNNPSWICFNEEELEIIGRMSMKHDVIILEDLAYFGMDFRKELRHPFQTPYQATVARYTDKYALLISASKAFSYAGQRIGVVAFSPTLYEREYPALKKRYGEGSFGRVFVHRVLYALSSGTAHTPQYAMAAMMKAAADGAYDFISIVKEYGRRAERLKKIFLKYGFKIVYDKDLDQEIADGFYFTIGYPGMTGSELMKELMYYGVSAISLETTGSNQQGLRACTSFIKEHQYAQLEERMQAFLENHPQ